MRNWRGVVTMALVLGLATVPLARQVEAEEVGTSSPETPPAGDHTHKHTKKETKAKSETKKTDSVAKEGTGEPHPDNHGVHGSSFDDIEGSH